MEGKTVILSVLITSLVMAQIQVEAKSCCPTQLSRNFYNTCVLTGASTHTCASLFGCKIFEGECSYDTLENYVDVINESCKLGCASSRCSAMTILQSYDASEIVNGTVEKCVIACSTLCSKSSKTA